MLKTFKTFLNCYSCYTCKIRKIFSLLNFIYFCKILRRMQLNWAASCTFNMLILLPPSNQLYRARFIIFNHFDLFTKLMTLDCWKSGCFGFLIFLIHEGNLTMRFASKTLLFILSTNSLISDTSLTSSFCQHSCIYLLQHSFIFFSYKLLSSLSLSFMTFPSN